MMILYQTLIQQFFIFKKYSFQKSLVLPMPAKVKNSFSLCLIGKPFPPALCVFRTSAQILLKCTVEQPSRMPRPQKDQTEVNSRNAFEEGGCLGTIAENPVKSMEFQVISLLLAHKKGNGEKYRKGQKQSLPACYLSYLCLLFWRMVPISTDRNRLCQGIF